MKKGKKGENYIFSNECLPYAELFSIIAELVGLKPIKKISQRWILAPAKLVLGAYECILAPFNKKPLLSKNSLDISFRFRYFNSAKARKELGWKPKVSFKNTMIKAIRFYEEQGLL